MFVFADAQSEEPGEGSPAKEAQAHIPKEPLQECSQATAQGCDVDKFANLLISPRPDLSGTESTPSIRIHVHVDDTAEHSFRY